MTGSLSIQEAINHTEVLDLVQQGVQLALQDKEITTPTNTVETSQTESVNSVTSDLTMQTIQQQMEIMRQMLETMKSMQSTNSGKKNKRNPNQSKYCWTHGLCSHYRTECRTPAEGHIPLRWCPALRPIVAAQPVCPAVF